MKTKNSGEGNQWSQCVQRRYVQKASLPDITAVQGVSSLSGDSKTAHHSPACMLEPSRNAVPFGTEVDTHTVPLCGARANDLIRHLKSLRNKRKKHRKSSAKRAREKDRCRKKVNT